MARLESMATIDAAFQPRVETDESTLPGKTDVTDPHPAPGVYPGTPGAEDTAPPPPPQNLEDGQGKNEEDVSERQKLLDRALKARAIEQQRQKDAFYKSASSTVGNAKKIVRKTRVRLESIPAPGRVLLPLLVLLVFFLLLLPVNGHTRFIWLWLVFTGNAEVTGSHGNNTNNSNPNNNTNNSNPNNNTNNSNPNNNTLGVGNIPIVGNLFFSGDTSGASNGDNTNIPIVGSTILSGGPGFTGAEDPT